MSFSINISETTLKTDRLILRPFQQSDLQDFFEYACVDGVGQMAGWMPHQTTEVTQMILDEFIEKKNVFAVVDITSNKVIGAFGIHLITEEPYVLSIGYVLAKPYWGQGLIPEAVKEVLSYLFKVIKVPRVTIYHFTDNYQSQRVIEKSGFTWFKTEDKKISQLGITKEVKSYFMDNPYQ